MPMPPENNQVPQFVPPAPQSVSAPTATTIPTPPTPVKIGKFKASKLIVKESWNVLKQDKEIMWFPVLSSVVTLLVVLAMAAFYFFVLLGGSLASFTGEGTVAISDVVAYGTLFIYYLVIFFIVNFFEAGLYTIVQARFSGQNLGFSDGIRGARQHMGKIFLWSLISATVGVILRIIADKSAIIGKIVAGVLGAAWNILTYFSLPSLIVGNTSVKDSFKDSASVIRKTWGETIIVNFGVGLFFFLIVILLMLVSIVLAIVLQSVIAAIVIGALFILSVIILSIVSTTLGSIFKLALYNYAKNGVVPQGFSPDVVRGAIKVGK